MQPGGWLRLIQGHPCYTPGKVSVGQGRCRGWGGLMPVSALLLRTNGTSPPDQPMMKLPNAPLPPFAHTPPSPSSRTWSSPPSSTASSSPRRRCSPRRSCCPSRPHRLPLPHHHQQQRPSRAPHPHQGLLLPGRQRRAPVTSLHSSGETSASIGCPSTGVGVLVWNVCTGMAMSASIGCPSTGVGVLVWNVCTGMAMSASSGCPSTGVGSGVRYNQCSGSIKEDAPPSSPCISLPWPSVPLPSI